MSSRPKSTFEVSTASWDALLEKVEKPSRYLGQEINAVHKAPEDVVLRAALVFPDLYEVGMSHLGTQILYGLGNTVDGVQVERLFLPAPDFLARLREMEMPLATLESRTPLARCHLLGVTLQSELTYTNILTILDASAIPLDAGDRGDQEPIVLGGGPCAFNPEPLARFFDLFFLGDGEEQWPAILTALRDLEQASSSRQEKMALLRGIPGIYDPREFQPEYDSLGNLKQMTRKSGERPIRPTVVESLDLPLPPSSYIVPFLPPVHDRVNIEATRGCTRGCRFCHAGMVYRPVRERSMSSLLQAAGDGLRCTGYGDLALTSLSIGDYGPLDEALEEIMDTFGEERVSLSLPSMRIGGLTPAVARQIQRVRRTGFTIAPEAGTERLRRVINKDFSDEEVLQTARWVFGHGWEALKLYFMIGLPTETDQDLEGIVELVGRILKEVPGRGKVTVNISPFVPKAHTPFQWVAQLQEPELKRRLDLLQKRLRGGRVQVRWGRTDQALLEAALARGDRRMSRVVETAWRMGAFMDGWEEHFQWATWAEAFSREGLDPGWYASRERPDGEILPWDHISCGVKRPFLLEEYRRSLSGEVTPDCREGVCHGCGACTARQMQSLPPLRKGGGAEGDRPLQAQATQDADRSSRRVRLVFSKRGDMRFLGHLEMARVFERASRRGEIPLAFTGGYSPKPRITFALSLPTGTEALGEWMDLELTESWSPEAVKERLNSNLPADIRIIEAWKTSVDGPALNGRVRSMTYEARLPQPVSGLATLVKRVMDRTSFPVERRRKGKVRTLDLKHYLLEMTAQSEETLSFTLALKGEEGSARPLEVLAAVLDCGEEALDAVRLTRTSLSFSLDPDRSGGRPGWARIWD